MLRRDALRLLASTAAIPVLRGLPQSQLLVLGRDVHAAARDAGSSVIGTLNAHEHATVAIAVERIIPATDTPGAADARVADFIDRMLAQWYPTEDRDRFVGGLAELDMRARREHGRAFLECPPLVQTRLLTALDDEVAVLRTAQTRAQADQHWFAMLKYLTIWGYCTSEVVQTGVLRLHPMPGRFDGCARV